MTLSFRNAVRGGLAAAGLVALAVGQNANAAVVPTIFDTGVLTNNTTTGAAATLAANGSVDTHYTITSSTTAPTTTPIGGAGASAFVLDPTLFPASVYAPYTDAKYISPAASSFGASNTYYDYRTTFDLTGFQAGTATLTGRFNDDDALYALFFNGVLTPIKGNITGTNNVTPGGDLTSTTLTFSLTSGFAAGVNTLDFVVYNSNSTGNNPNALAVGNLRLNATANPTVPEPGSVAMLVGIGVSGAGFLIRRKRRA